MDNEHVKANDEKYCSECGQLINIKAEICPKCGVRQVITLQNTDSSSSNEKKLGEKFFISSGIALVLFIIIVISTQPGDQILNGIIGSFMFALVAGLIAMAIPSTKKIIYVPSSVAIMFFAAFLVGISTQ